MQVTRSSNIIKSRFKTFLTASASVLALCLPAAAQSTKVEISPAPNVLLPLQAGGAYGGNTPMGATISVNAGTLYFGTSYGNTVDSINYSAAAPALTVLQGTYNGPGPIIFDAGLNMYIGDLYDQNVVKVPPVNGAYAVPSYSSAGVFTPAVANCMGGDTVPCVLPNPPENGYASLTFDSAGNLYEVMQDSDIWLCSVACQTTTGTAPVQIYNPPFSDNTEQFGTAVVDANKNLWLSLGIYQGKPASEESKMTELVELPYTNGAYPTGAPTVIYTYTPTTVAAYDAVLTSLNLGSDGTLYFATTQDGIFALPESGGAPNPSGQIYQVSTQGMKELAIDASGNFVGINYSGSGDTVIVQPTPPINAGTVVANSSGTVSATTIVNSAACATSSVTFSATPSNFSAALTPPTGTATSSCSAGLLGGSLYATTVTYSPATTGTQTGTLTATDQGGNTGTASLTGTGGAAVVATPTATPAAGAVAYGSTVALADTTAGSTIYYEVSTTGTPNSPITSTGGFDSGAILYTSPITITQNETIVAEAVASGYATSPALTAAYTVTLGTALAAPTATPAGGTYTAAQVVTLAGPSSSAVYYTLDGSTPTTGSTLYTTPIYVGASETINAIATQAGFTSSTMASFAYVISIPVTPPVAAAPTFSPAGGPYTSTQSVTLASTTPAAIIYYTTNGMAPTTSSTMFVPGTPISVGSTEVIEAIATAAGFSTSPIATAAYTITLPTPSFTVAAATPASLTLAYGATGTVAVAVTPVNGFSSAVTLTCTGLPTGASCSPTTVTPSGTTASTATITVTASPSAPTVAMNRSINPLIPGGITAAFALGMFGFRKRRRLQALLLLTISVIGLGMLAGCSGGGATSSSTGTSSYSSEVLVTATSGNVTQTTSFELIEP